MRWWQWFFWGLAARLSTGCRHALSPAVRQQIDTTLSFTQLRTTPEAYKDRIVMLGGDILSTRNLTQGTLFEVLQKPLDATDRPLDMDRTEGRFMALCEGYLDPEVYAVWSTAWLCPHAAQLPSSMDRCTAQARRRRA